MTLALYPLAVILAVLFLGVGAVRATPAYRHWQHQRCLVRIAALEQAVGFEVSNPELLPQPKRTPEAVAERWNASVSRAASNYSAGFAAKPLRVRRVKQRRKSELGELRPLWRRY